MRQLVSSRPSAWRFWLMLGSMVVAVAVGFLILWPRTQSVPPEPTQGQTAKIEKPTQPPGGYIGSTACAECHADIVRRYAEHPMGRSLAHVLDAEQVEDYDDASFVRGHRTYRVERTADGIVHHESMTGIDGEPIYEQGVDVAYALGSGRRGRGYVINRGGLPFQSPISWYSGRRRWDLSPGYAPDSPRFERPTTEVCLGCHSGRLNLPPGGHRYGDPLFLEEAIGCERCHGPGQEHVERYRSGDMTRPDPIVNPVALEPARREAVCEQCHLQGEHRFLRYGRSEEDFRPGDRLEDVWTIFVAGTGLAEDGTTTAVSQVEQMRSSRCFLESDGRLGCISCHDPHGVPAPKQRASFFDGRCLACHQGPPPAHVTTRPGPTGASACALPLAEQQKAPAAGSCIHCHMPRLAAADVPHTSQSDHRILRRPAEVRPGDRPGFGDGDPELFAGAEDRLPAVEVARAKGLRLAQDAYDAGDAVLAARAEPLLLEYLAAASDDSDVLEALGDTAEILGRHDDAIRRWRRAAEVAPNPESSLSRLAAAGLKAGRLSETLEVLDRLVAVNPWVADNHGRRAYVLARLGRLEEAGRAAEQALELNPSLRQTYRSTAELRRALGDTAGAERYLRLFSRFPSE